MKKLLVGLALLLAAMAFALDPAQLLPAGEATLKPFLSLALVITAGLVAERVGLFSRLAGLLVGGNRGRLLSAMSVLVFTALVSGLVNLDVAVVVAVPLAVRVAAKRGLDPSFLAICVALAANATSFLLPTANLTNLLLLTRHPLGWDAYVAHSWLAWLLVASVSVATLGCLSARHETPFRVEEPAPATSGPGLLVDLLPTFVAASSIRALVGYRLQLAPGPAGEAGAFLLAAVVNNLPAASALQFSGSSAFWATILAMAMGPNLLLTGSVASLIARGLASRRAASFGFARFTLVGGLVLPLQVGAAWAGLSLVAGWPAAGR